MCFMPCRERHPSTRHCSSFDCKAIAKARWYELYENHLINVQDCKTFLPFMDWIPRLKEFSTGSNLIPQMLPYQPRRKSPRHWLHARIRRWCQPLEIQRIRLRLNVEISRILTKKRKGKSMTRSEIQGQVMPHKKVSSNIWDCLPHQDQPWASPFPIGKKHNRHNRSSHQN